MDSGEEVMIGVNKFIPEEKSSVGTFEIGPEVEKVATERVKEFREKRNNKKIKQAMDRLKKVAEEIEEGGWKTDMMLMPAVIDAAKADATLGEMMDVLREVFGWGYVS